MVLKNLSYMQNTGRHEIFPTNLVKWFGKNSPNTLIEQPSYPICNGTIIIMIWLEPVLYVECRLNSCNGFIAA